MGAALVRLLAATWRYRVRGWEHVEAARERRRPIVYVLWHSRILPLLYHRRGGGVALLVSGDDVRVQIDDGAHSMRPTAFTTLAMSS